MSKIVKALVGGSSKPKIQPPPVEPAPEPATKPEPEPVTDPLVLDEEERRRRVGKGTLLTSEQGVLGGAPVQRKSLLGA